MEPVKTLRQLQHPLEARDMSAIEAPDWPPDQDPPTVTLPVGTWVQVEIPFPWSWWISVVPDPSDLTYPRRVYATTVDAACAALGIETPTE